MKNIHIQVLVLVLSFTFIGQIRAQVTLDSISGPYVFTSLVKLPASPVKDQAASGTCWSFATTSFLESEIIRLTGDTLDLSEMYFVREAYKSKAERYVRLHGTSNFGEGGQAHDVINVLRQAGFMTQADYPGLANGQEKHNHAEMDAVLKAVVETIAKNPGGKVSPEWTKVIDGILDVYLGKLPEQEMIKGKKYPPRDAPGLFHLDPEKYVELTSFSHKPFHQEIQLEVPDNWAMEKYLNIPVDELINVMEHALESGYTVCWDGDVSNKGFSHKNNLALVPNVKLEGLEKTEREKWEQIPEKDRAGQFYNFKRVIPEKNITQDSRQTAFDDYSATDDHLMHITGMVSDQFGNKYFLTKNSWSKESNDMGGYLYLSVPYVKLYTIAILVNIESLPKDIRKEISKE